MKQAFPCMMWGSCEEAAVGYFMSVAPSGTPQEGEMSYTHSCAEHAEWFVERHPEQTFIRPGGARSELESEQPA